MDSFEYKFQQMFYKANKVSSMGKLVASRSRDTNNVSISVAETEKYKL